MEGEGVIRDGGCGMGVAEPESEADGAWLHGLSLQVLPEVAHREEALKVFI